ncbi:MAG: cytochrome c biogenesis protein ResB [Mycobacterium leprae]
MAEKDVAPELEQQGAVVEEAEEEVEVETEPAKPTKGLLERTWDFFASVPVATVLLFVIAVASVAGTLIEQEGTYSDWRTPDQYYPVRYGPMLGKFLFRTGMTRMYTSWWFMTLLLMLGASLVVCSLERFVPLWRAVQRPNPNPPEGFIRHLKHRFTYEPAEGQAPLSVLAAALRARHYKLIEKDGRLYADKGRWGRWGPYITHIGLLLILIGAMMRAIPGFYLDTSIAIHDGEVSVVPTTNWAVRNDQFVMEFYENGQPKSYTTHATVLDGGQEVKKFNITMNYPLQYKWMELYQSSYDMELGKATVAIVEKNGGKTLGTFDINLFNPADSYAAAGYTLKTLAYFSDFTIGQDGKPTSASSKVKNPGIQFEVTPPSGPAYQTWYFPAYPEMHLDEKAAVTLKTADQQAIWTTYLKVKKDLGLPVIYLGLIIVSLGVFATFYIAHKRYWAYADGDRVVVGGWTNRNQGSLAREIAFLGNMLDPKTNPKQDLTEGEER